MQRSATAVRRILRLRHVRRANRAVILQLLRHGDCLSRADIARQSGLSEGAVSRIIGGLIRDRLVREDGEENSTGGRPGRRLQLDQARIAFGAEIDNWETRFAVVNMRGRIVESWRRRTPAAAHDALVQVAAEFLQCRERLGTARVQGLGVCLRGIVDSRTGTLIQGNRTDWANIPVRANLESRISEPTFVENNVRAATLAEYSYGAREVYGARCFTFVMVSDGVGVGILFDGKPYYGPRMAAGEFGQMVITHSEAGRRHDREGCLERLASNASICERYSATPGARRFPAGADTSARVRRIAQSALNGDAAAVATLEQTAIYLGAGISNIVWGLDADVVVVDGAITGAWRLMAPLIRDQLPDLPELSNLPLILRSSALSGDAALIGAATLPFTTVFAADESGPYTAVANQ